MSKLDRYAEDIKKLSDLERLIKQNLKERETQIKMGNSAGKYNYLLSQQATNIKDDIKNLEKLAYNYETQPQNYPELNAKELQKRVDKIKETKDRMELLATEVNSILNPNASAINSATGGGFTQQNDLESRPLIQRGEDGEFEDTRGKDSRQLLTQQKQMIRNQDEHLDEIAGIVQNIKYENQNFAQEVTYQNKMLTDLNSQVERTHQKMVKVDSKLKELIAKSNQWCLWVIIVIELVILILLVVL